MKKLAHWGLGAFVGLFLCLCLLPSAGMLAAPPEEAVGNEHLTALPTLKTADGQWNGSYFTQLSDWLADHIAFRHELITLHSRLCGTLFGTLPNQEVVLGKDGWLYYADTLADYQGIGQMSGRESWAAARALYLMQESCRQQGVRFLFTVAPNKNSLYPEAMPARFRRGEAEGNAAHIAARLEEMGVEYLDLFALLGGQEQALYFRTDSHWNNLGAALAGDALNSALGKPEDPFWGQPYQTAPTHKGDLYEMVYPAGDLLEEDAVFDRAFRFTYPNGVRSAEDITIRTRNDGAEGSLLMFRDSFGNALYPFLAERYGNACFSRAMPYDLTYLEREGADTLVVEIVERNLRWLIQRPPVLPAPVRTDAPANWQQNSALAASADAATSTALEGYVEIGGTIQCPVMDEDSPIYLRAGGQVYEATPAGEGDCPFTAFLPAAAAEQPLELAVRCNGVWNACTIALAP